MATHSSLSDGTHDEIDEPVEPGSVVQEKESTAFHYGQDDMTATTVYSSVADTTDLMCNDGKAVMKDYMGVCSEQFRRTGFKSAGLLHSKFKQGGRTAGSQGRQSFHQKALRIQS
jgi:hypothetical protein